MRTARFWVLFPSYRKKMRITKHIWTTIKRPVIWAGLFLVFSILALAPPISKAQWKPMFVKSDVNGNSNGGFFADVYFIDLQGPPLIGFAITTDTFYRTTDGGGTWNVIPGVVGEVYDYTFKDSLTGWSAALPPYITTNGGATWFELSGGGSASVSGIFYDSLSDGLFLSGDNIVSW